MTAVIWVVAAVAAAVVALLTIPRTGRHTKRAQRAGFEDPAEVTDPHGDIWLTQLLQDRPALSYRRPGGTPVCVLPLPHETGPLPWAVGHWGMSAHDKADELARRYMEVTH